MFYNYKDPVVINRGKWRSHKLTKDINYIIPALRIKDLEGKFICTYDVKRVKTEVFKRRNNTLKK